MSFSIYDEFDIPEGWKPIKLKELADFNKEAWKKTNQPEHIHYIDIKSVSTGTMEKPTYMSFSEAPSRARRIVNDGDIIISTVRPNLKQFTIIENRNETNLTASTGFCTIRAKDEKFKWFIYAIITSDFFTRYLERTAEGAAYPAFKPIDISESTVALPPEDELETISSIVKSLYRKKAVNNSMNATLEKIAQRIFKSWFVDFDPVKANAEDVPFDGLSSEIQALFPNEFEESELGMIPKGWEVKSLDEIAHFLNGLACQKHRPKDGETPLPVIKIAEMRAGYQEKTNEASPNVDPKYIIQDGDFLFSWSGSLTTCFWSHGPGVLNQHLFKVTSENYPKWFFSMWVNIHLAEFIRIAADKATTMGHIKREHLSQAKVVVPNLEDLMSKGNDIFGPLIERSNLCLTQAKTLMKVRDKLLPRLISGKITIQKAEELLEEAS